MILDTRCLLYVCFLHGLIEVRRYFLAHRATTGILAHRTNDRRCLRLVRIIRTIMEVSPLHLQRALSLAHSAASSRRSLSLSIPPTLSPLTHSHSHSNGPSSYPHQPRPHHQLNRHQNHPHLRHSVLRASTQPVTSQKRMRTMTLTRTQSAFPARSSRLTVRSTLLLRMIVRRARAARTRNWIS